MPLISVITPAFNSTQTLGKAIDSVRAQSFQDWEMIIVDDASHDATTALASRYAQEDERIRIIRRAENGGIAVSRNQSITAATGRFIAFLNADDFWTSEKLDHQLAFMQEQKATISSTAYRCFNDPENLSRIKKSAPRITFDRLLYYNPIRISTVMIDRETSGPFSFDERFFHQQDFALWLLLTKSGHDIYFLNDDLARHHTEGNYLSIFYEMLGLWRACRQNAGLKTLDTLKVILGHGIHSIWRCLF